jgi:hypothetical protein
LGPSRCIGAIQKHADGCRGAIEKSDLLKDVNGARQIASIENNVDITSIPDNGFIHLSDPELDRVSADHSIRNLRGIQRLRHSAKSILNDLHSSLNPLPKGITRIFDRNHFVTSNHTIPVTSPEPNVFTEELSHFGPR